METSRRISDLGQVGHHLSNPLVSLLNPEHRTLNPYVASSPNSLKAVRLNTDKIRGAFFRFTTSHPRAPMHIALPKAQSGAKLSPHEQRLGFLAAQHDPSLGYAGGYLLTTARGRPLEFHYATPVKPTPTHRTRYGPELEPYVLAELIGSTLMRQCTIEVAFIVTDQPHLLSQRKSWPGPIVCVQPRGTIGSQETETNLAPMELCGHPDFPDDVAALERWMEEVNPGLNLNEPFVRVWEALREVLSADTQSRAA